VQGCHGQRTHASVVARAGVHFVAQRFAGAVGRAVLATAGVAYVVFEDQESAKSLKNRLRSALPPRE